jgi:hypothetical protein
MSEEFVFLLNTLTMAAVFVAACKVILTNPSYIFYQIASLSCAVVEVRLVLSSFRL